jgi:cobalt-zinc-cadmium efflux system membrane fusion protein
VLSPELGTAIGDHLAATARLEAARARRERIETLRAGGFSSLAEVAEAEADYTVAAAEAEAAEERLRVFGVSPERVRPKEGEHFSSRFAVKSPIEGEVLSIDVSLGASVDSGDPLFHVGNLDEVWLILDVYERSLAKVQVGASVSFTADAYGDEVFTGTVDQIGGWLDPDSRTAEVRVVVPNPDHRLKPNMFAKARLALGGEGHGEGLVVPADAVQDIEGRPSAFIEEVPGRYAVRPVRTEPLPDGRLRVISGLEAGDKVVFEGAFTLKSELAKSELGVGHAH